jgi:uncharacterized protein with PQ loop repeat
MQLNTWFVRNSVSLFLLIIISLTCFKINGFLIHVVEITPPLHLDGYIQIDRGLLTTVIIYILLHSSEIHSCFFNISADFRLYIKYHRSGAAEDGQYHVKPE